ncbi:MAG: hypothetical protein ACUVS7_07815 [Bryobacteraceae bacterium]
MPAVPQRKIYRPVSDFDHTLSFNDSGLVLSELLGVPAFEEKVRSLERFHLVQRGGELAYLLLHDPRVSAGQGKAAVLEEIRRRLGVSCNRVDYVGDGSSDLQVMLHLNRNDGLTVAVSENRFITQIARRTVLGDDALSVAVPILEEIPGWDSPRVRAYFEAHGVTLREWTKVRSDRLNFAPNLSSTSAPQ